MPKLNSSDTNIFNVFSNIATGRSRVCEVYEDIEENYTSEIFQGKENKNWKGVESLNLDYHSLELQKENGVSKKETMIKSRYLSEIEKEKIEIMDFKCENISTNENNEVRIEKTDIEEFKISTILPKVESQNFEKKKSITEFKEESEETESIFNEPRPSVSSESKSKTFYESFTNDHYDQFLRSPTRKVAEWTPNPYSPCETSSKIALKTKISGL